LPRELNGTLYRNGPNPQFPSPTAHWFVGDGMLHAFHLENGKASYRNRWVRTDPVAQHLGEPAVGGPSQPLYDSSNTNVVGFAGKILSLTEGCYPYELSRQLETVCRVDFDSTLPHGLTAHPKVDPVTGELHGFAYWWEEPYLLYHVFDPDGRLRVSEPIALPAPVSMHDFAITENHVLFFDQPAVFDLAAVATIGFPFSWQPDNGARVGVLPRGGSAGDVHWYETEICYCFHPLNAYEETDGSIVVDVPKLPSVYETTTTIIDEAGCLERWTIDPSAGKVRQELVDETTQEFCQVNQAKRGSRHRYGYTVAMGDKMPFDDSRVFKHDFDTGNRESHDFGPGRHPGEFIFVPDPERAGEEDGGWLMGLVHDDGWERTSLAVLDAQDVAGPPLGQVHLPVRVPYGFHGTWIPDDAS
jgi:carotenoid cleavage dioxygenase